MIRASFTDWVEHCGFKPAKHHQILIDALSDVASGECDRLMVFMPPGSAKSTYGSMLFPPWFMAQHPDKMVMAVSHTHELASRWGRKCRNLVAEHSLVLGINVADGDSAADRWGLAQGGEYFAAGVGGSVTGRRADLAILDDPVRSREDAESALIRDKTDDWYRSDLLTRLKPGGRVVLIMTRWHTDDISGRLLEQAKAGGDEWRVISLPALAEPGDLMGRKPGEALWPEWETKEQLERKRAALQPREWSALYQQQPTPDEGDYFKGEWLVPVLELPPRATLRVYGGSDYAVTADGGDYTVHAVVGIDPDGKLWLLDLWRKQAASDEWVEAFCDLVKKWRPSDWAEETGQIKAGVGPFLERRMREKSAYVVRHQFPTRGDKAIRAQSIRGRMAMDGLRVLATAPFRNEFISELLRFPAGVHDDQVDALGLVGQLLDKMIKGSALKPAEPPKPDKAYRPMGERARGGDALTL